MLRVFTWLLGLLIPATASTEEVLVHLSSGTGFFISAYGDLVTNAHVVSDCRFGTIELFGATKSPARLVAIDRQHDLALLRAVKPSPDAAQLSMTEDTIAVGDPVIVVGYPVTRKYEYEYAIAHAEITDVRGPRGEAEWLQFSDSAQHGNSGGPLLDDTGNVIGVVTSKSLDYRENVRTRERTLVGSSDIAVALPVLKHFLIQNQVRYRQGGSQVIRSMNTIEYRARQFVTQIQCVTSEEPVK